MEVEMGNGNVREDEDEEMEEDLEAKMERIHAEENGDVVAVEPQAPEDMEDQGWKINGMSVEELEALEQLEEAEEINDFAKCQRIQKKIDEIKATQERPRIFLKFEVSK